ncbi:MAG: alpha/beta fold hydrolase [Verrucomicrobiota bacterium]
MPVKEMATLHYQSYGAGEPLIVLHGLLGMSDNWATLSRRFGDTFRVLAVDLRNHGKSPHGGEMNYEVMAGDVRELLQREGIARARMLGHSLGGKVAMQFALMFPPMIERLVVVDIAPRDYAPQHTELIDAMLSLDLARFTQRQQIDEALAVRIPQLHLRQFLLKNLGRDESGAFRWKVNLPAIRQSYERLNQAPPATGSFAGKVLFVRGTRSDYIRAEDEAAIRQRFPRADIVDIAGAGHWVHADAPEEFFRVCHAFLNQPG